MLYTALRDPQPYQFFFVRFAAAAAANSIVALQAYFGDTDMRAHQHGGASQVCLPAASILCAQFDLAVCCLLCVCAQWYQDAVTNKTRILERVIQLVDEQTTVVVATDHGHVDVGGHGGAATSVMQVTCAALLQSRLPSRIECSYSIRADAVSGVPQWVESARDGRRSQQVECARIRRFARAFSLVWFP